MTAGPFQIGLVHRVLPDPAAAVGPDRTCAIPPAELDAWLTRRGTWWKPAPAELLAAPLPAGRPGLLLTCDDGFRDFAEQTLPLLERHGVHAILFVVDDFAAGRREPYERLLARLAPADWQERRLALKPLSPARRWQAVEALAAARGRTPEELFAGDLLTRAEIAELDRHPLVTVGSHGLGHAFLPGLSAAEARREMEGSRVAFERLLGRPVPHFSYPYGAHNRRLRRLARRSGYRFGYTTEARSLAARDLRRGLALPRLDLAGVPAEAV